MLRSLSRSVALLLRVLHLMFLALLFPLHVFVQAFAWTDGTGLLQQYPFPIPSVGCAAMMVGYAVQMLSFRWGIRQVRRPWMWGCVLAAVGVFSWTSEEVCIWLTEYRTPWTAEVSAVRAILHLMGVPVFALYVGTGLSQEDDLCAILPGAGARGSK